jgi:hypothetical protein
MTDEQRDREGIEEPIEDLEAPAGSQDDVVGGAHCLQPSCANSKVVVACSDVSHTCAATSWDCADATKAIVIHAM